MSYRLHYDDDRRVELRSYDTEGAAMKAAKRKINEPEQTAWRVDVVQHDEGAPRAVKMYYNYTNLAAKINGEPVAPSSPARKAVQRMRLLAMTGAPT